VRMGVDAPSVKEGSVLRAVDGDARGGDSAHRAVEEAPAGDRDGVFGACWACSELTSIAPRGLRETMAPMLMPRRSLASTAARWASAASESSPVLVLRLRC